jgi:hypothetical protein
MGLGDGRRTSCNHVGALSGIRALPKSSSGQSAVAALCRTSAQPTAVEGGRFVQWPSRDTAVASTRGRRAADQGRRGAAGRPRRLACGGRGAPRASHAGTLEAGEPRSGRRMPGLNSSHSARRPPGMDSRSRMGTALCPPGLSRRMLVESVRRQSDRRGSRRVRFVGPAQQGASEPRGTST